VELRHLRHFAVLAETLSFTDAAVLLRMSQPALSASLRVLEDELGAKLVDRSSRRITLTPAGQRLRPEVRRLLDLAGALPALARSSPETITGTVALGLVQSVSHLDLAGLLSEIRAAYPGVGFRVVQETAARMRQQLRNRTLDLTFLYDADRGAAGLSCTTLYEERLVVIVPEGHELADRRRLDIHELRGQNWIDLARGTDLAATVEALDRRHHLGREVTAQVSQLGVLTDLVRAGLGIAIVPEDIARAAGATVLELTGQPLRRSVMLAHRAEALSPAAGLVAQRIISRATARPATGSGDAGSPGPSGTGAFVEGAGTA
jgi:DNA-binding transcriptional LysR family regulator